MDNIKLFPKTLKIDQLALALNKLAPDWRQKELGMV